MRHSANCTCSNCNLCINCGASTRHQSRHICDGDGSDPSEVMSLSRHFHTIERREELDIRARGYRLSAERKRRVELDARDADAGADDRNDPGIPQVGE